MSICSPGYIIISGNNFLYNSLYFVLKLNAMMKNIRTAFLLLTIATQHANGQALRIPDTTN
jgi:hypothetical protein